MMLHELGHFLIDQSNKSDRFNLSMYASEQQVATTQQVAVDRIEEELEAWSRGWKLAKRLKLKLDHRYYQQCKTRFVMTYINHAAMAQRSRRPLMDKLLSVGGRAFKAELKRYLRRTNLDPRALSRSLSQGTKRLRTCA